MPIKMTEDATGRKTMTSNANWTMGLILTDCRISKDIYQEYGHTMLLTTNMERITYLQCESQGRKSLTMHYIDWNDEPRPGVC
jgi:hypothetical protein